jgi:hypothetical protein
VFSLPLVRGEERGPLSSVQAITSQLATNQRLSDEKPFPSILLVLAQPCDHW